MSIENGISEIVKGYILEYVNINDLGCDVDIFEEGLVNSLFAIELMTFLEKSFSIKVTMDDLDMNNFKSIKLITTFVNNKKAEGCK